MALCEWTGTASCIAPSHFLTLLSKDACRLTCPVSYLQYHVYCWERLEQQLLPACSLAAGKPIITTCVIIDLSRLSMKNFTMQAQNLIRGLAKVDQVSNNLGCASFQSAGAVESEGVGGRQSCD